MMLPGTIAMKIRSLRPLSTSAVRLRYIVIGLLLFAGIRSLLKGLGIWN